MIPVGATSLIKVAGSALLFWLVEGVLRMAIFIGYLALISKLPDLRRVFQYHGAEHKTISTFEAGDELTPANARRYSRLHPRCGTSFLLIVMCWRSSSSRRSVCRPGTGWSSPGSSESR